MNTKITNNAQGFSLIEVMIAIVITSAGFLTFAGLQLDGLKQIQGALVRSEASILVTDMSDRMRANQPGALAGGYNHTLISNALNCNSTCSPYEYAIYEVKDWIDLLNKQLPSASATITCVDSDSTDALPCSKNSVHTLQVSWDNNRDGIANATMEVEVRL